MLTIVEMSEIPDETYFKMSDISPFLEGDTLYIYNGRGTRRNWGIPQVTSTVVCHEENFTAIHVGFSHKHKGSQGWFYYVENQRVTWNRLTLEQQKSVLSEVEHLPAWIKRPGYIIHNVEHLIGYKLVRRYKNGSLRSLYNPQIQYNLGVTLDQLARVNHGGGYYFFPSKETAYERLEEYRNAFFLLDCNIALISVEINGKVIDYGNKYAGSSITPLQILEVFPVDG